MLYFRPVQFVRHSRLAQTMAFLLLLWTAIDLINPSACAVDVAATRSAVMHAADNVATPIGGAPAGPVDDCFCCSHCVRPSVIAVPTLWCPAVRQRRTMCADRVISADRAAVYHPPQIFS